MQQRFSTCNATMLRCKLQQFVARIASPLHQIAIKIFSLVYLQFGKLQSNTFTERIPKISTD